jgi:hypothetical protein
MYYNSYSNTKFITTPLKEISSRDYEGREVKGEQGTVIDHFFGLSGTKVGVIIFLIPGSGLAYYQWELIDGNKL